MLKKRALLVVVFVSLVVSTCPLLYGQATGSFSGTVSDKAGAVVSGATVKATSQGTGISREAKTDGSGHYLIPLLPVAFYTMRVEAQGFGPAEQKDIRLQVDEHREVDFTLVPASVSTAVEVSATEVAVETANPTLGQVITAEQVADLPLNGRNFVQLATLTPGTTAETNPTSFFNGAASSEASTRGAYSLSVGGSRAQSTDWLLDGNDNNQLDEGGIAIFSSIDSIQEFKVLTYNYSAEYGERAGPTVLVTTKSGSNAFHGTLFEFFRNTKLDARSYFASTTEKFNLNQFGGSFGGPIRKDKTFFFADYQAKMQRRGILFNGFVPTAQMRTGDFSSDLYGQPVTTQILYNPYTSSATARSPFMCNAGVPIPANSDGTQTGGSPCNKIPSNLQNPIAQALLAQYPATVPTPAGSGYNFLNEPVRRLNEATADFRLDHNFSSKDSLFARFSYDQAVSFVPGGADFAESNTFGSTENITNHGRNVALSETHVFSDRTINQFNAGYNRIFNNIKSFDYGTCEAAKLNIPGANIGAACDSITGYSPSLSQSTQECVSCGLTSVQPQGPYWSLGDRGFSPYQGGTNVFSISDSFDMIRGKHNIRVGMTARDNQMNVLTNAFQDGYWLYTNDWSNSGVSGAVGGDNMADVLMGLPSLAIHDQTFNGATTGRRWKLFRPFVQDDWRVSNNLTLNLGVAWALVTPETEAHNRLANFNFATGQYLVAGPAVPGCSICVQSNSRVGIQMDKTAIEPRIGFAWKPMGSQNTAIRGGYAIFHDSSWNQGGQGLWENPPYFAESDFFGFDTGGCPPPTIAVPNPQCTAYTNATNPFNFGQSMTTGFVPIFGSAPNPQNFTGTIQTQNLNFKQGMIQQFNLNVEHQLLGNLVLTAGYAGSRSSHILVDGVNENVGSPGACGVVPGYTRGCGPGGTSFAAPFGPFTTVSNNNDIGQARYDSVQIKAETKSARHGLYALVGYTLSKTYDSGMPDGLGSMPGATYWPLPGARSLDWGPSQLDLTHSFTASVLYNLPFGKGKRFGSSWNGPVNAILGNWEMDVIEKVTSGFPLFMTAGNNASGVNFQWNGASLNRPDEVGNPLVAGTVAANPTCIAPARIHTLANWFNPCAFKDAAPGELGNSPRAPVFGPGFVNTDLSLIKHFQLHREGMRVDFRAEFFNLFNHPQFFLPGTAATQMQDVDSPASFGVVTETTNNPRLVQFALKLIF
jgi:hypothetical protein